MKYLSIFLTLFVFIACTNQEASKDETVKSTFSASVDISSKLNEYKKVRLSSDLSHLSENQKQLISLLIDAADIMDELFWMQTYGDKKELLENIDDSLTREYVKINYGPWDRLDADNAFIENVGEKPLGANFYPQSMTQEEFDLFEDEDKKNLYTILRHDENGSLYCIPYHKAYADQVAQVSMLLDSAASLAEDDGFKKYLKLRSEAIITDEYYESDLAWMDMKNNLIDVVIGPIENYEDQLYNYKTAYEAYVLIKDVEWSQKLERFLLANHSTKM